MLIQFSVENFMSFKEKAVLALNPSVDNEHMENVNEVNGYKAGNVLAIYGANASGKTSLFKAMTVALNMIRNSNYMQVNQFIPFITRFIKRVDHLMKYTIFSLYVSLLKVRLTVIQS